MHTKTNAFLIAFFLMIVGCQRESRTSDPVVRIPFEHSDMIDLEKFIVSVHYVQLQNHPESAFTDIDKLLVSGDNMFLLDKRLKAVFCFDRSGNFRYRIQRVGRGPGEYLELDAMWVKPSEKELWLQSFWPPKIMVYDYAGAFLREFTIRWPARDMTGIGGNLIAAYNTTASIDGRDSLQAGVFMMDPQGKSADQALVIGDTSIYWSLVHQRNLEEYEDGAILLSQSDTLFRISRNGTVKPDACLDWGRLTFPEDLRKICYYSPRSAEVLHTKSVSAKDQLIAFGPIRLFRVFLDGHMELAIADLQSGRGVYSTQLTCRTTRVPLLYPLAKSDQGELIGMYDMSLLLAMKESQAGRKSDAKSQEFYHEMDSLVESAIKQDRPFLWIAKIKPEWLTKSK